MKTLFSCVFIVLILVGCSSTISTTNTGQERIKTHRSIAILPFEVRFDLRNKNRKKFTEKELSDLRHFMATGLQDYLYNWLKTYSYRQSFTVTIQNTDITDSILAAQQISYLVLYNMGRTELAKLLGVDAVLTPNVIFAQPNSEEVSMLLSPVGSDPSNIFNPDFFNSLATQEMRMQVLLNDRFSETSLWTFETKTQSSKATRRVSNDPQKNILTPLFANIDKTLNRFIRNFPYKKT
ncbi:MAG: hypothetical protein ACKOU7_01645 [Ferruginibacter sp.]